MRSNDGRSRSIWMDTAVAPDADPLHDDASADVAVIGAGIAGLSIAYELAREGLSVIVLDRGAIAGGMTARTTAHLAPICDDSLSELLSMRGEELARGFQESQQAAVDRIESIQREEEISCDFRRLDGVLFAATPDDLSILDDEVEAAQTIGVAVRRETGLPFAGCDEAEHLRYPGQAAFHPLKYVAGLCTAIGRKGGRVHPHSPAVEIREAEDGVVLRLANERRVTAGYAVVATNSPITDRVAIHTKQAPYRTYAMAFRIARGRLPDALYWDTLDPYHYVRLTPGEDGSDIVIVGGEDHKSGTADDAEERFAALEVWMRGLLPDLGAEVTRWSGQVMDTLDYAGFIGLDPGSRRIFVATGDSGQGMTHGVVASLLVPDLIAGRANPWAQVYDPSRKPLKAAATYLQENATALKSFAEYVAPGERPSVDELGPGEGAIVREGLRKIAAYRDEAGTLHRRSAACTHTGCHLHWNGFERCWDCPCHGSHFSPEGAVLSGPAITPLASV